MTNYTQWKSLVDLHEYSAIPDGTVLLPEEDDLNHFVGDTELFSVDNGDKSREQEFVLTSNDGPDIYSSSGLPNYPSVGDTHEIWFWAAETDWGFDLGFAASDRVNDADAYQTRIRSDGSFELNRRDSGSKIDLDTTGFSISTQEWYRLEMGHESNGDISVSLIDESQNVLETLNANDTTHITDGEYDSEGVYINQFWSTETRYEGWIIL